jgi:hypothetical protein
MAIHNIQTEEGCACGFIEDEEPPDPHGLGAREKLRK